MSITIRLEQFEGPLGLLLHLIRQEEMDIFNININQITRQYLDYIREMKKLDLELAGEFVAMAATLIHIKSRLLLPQYNEQGEELQEDPRRELVQKLLEYQRYQEASKKLYQRPLMGRDMWPRGTRENLGGETHEDIVIEEDNALFALISAYRRALKNIKKGVHQVVGALESIAERILRLKDRFVVGQPLVFSQLIDGPEFRGNQILVTFLSVLELAKMGFISLFQAENFSEIHIDTKKVIDRDVIQRAESFENTNAEAVADSILAQAEDDVRLAKLDEDERPDTTVTEEESLVAAATDEEILAEESKLDVDDLQESLPLPDLAPEGNEESSV